MGAPADMTAALTPIPRGQGRFFLRASLSFFAGKPFARAVLANSPAASTVAPVPVCGGHNGVADLRSPAGNRRRCFRAHG
jgi:hypothetical protein